MGRRWKDERHCLDLSRYDDVQLLFSNTATSTEFTTNIQVDIIGLFLREPAGSPIGYYKEVEHKSWSPVADEWEDSNLPTDQRIRRILLRGRPAVDTADAKNKSSLGRLLYDLYLTKRSREIELWHGSAEQLGHLSVFEHGRYAESMTHIDRTDEYGYDVGVGYVMHGVVAEGTQTSTPSATASVGAGDIQDSAQEVKQRTADQPLQGFWRGWGMLHNIPLWESRRDDDTDLIDPSSDKSVEVRVKPQSGTTVTGTAHNAQNAIILSTLVPY